MPNRLIHEKSPYLIQHAHNPVDWFPWGQEAFTQSRQENKPVFLSIGYATCHWCHVMERECFEDHEAAAALNEAFVCIKVDREERPDIDAVYMAACQMVTGSGGWPLNLILTPDKKPFFAATYLPKRSRFGRPGLLEVCAQIQSIWRDDPSKAHVAADQIADHLDKAFTYSAGAGPDLDLNVLDKAFAQISRSYDPQYGGFDQAPKFPTPHRLLFLLRHHHRTGNSHALEMVTHTLDAMRQGGLWDHVGFGFHRYATDSRWLLPHFEKMLYDQALLAMAYLEAFQISGNPFFAQTAEEIFAYVRRDMTHPEGGFYSAEDADSEGEEGKFYVWDMKSFNAIAADREQDIAWDEIFNLHQEGNYEDEATARRNGTNIVHMTRSWDQWAKTLGLEASSLVEKWDTVRQSLFDQRKHRVPPLKDDKVLTDWNGLMIAAFAMGARVLGDAQYSRMAENAVGFIRSRLQDTSAGLLHRYRDGQAIIAAQAADYAYLIFGLIELYRASYQTDMLAYAIELQRQMDADFWDDAQGGYFLTPSDHAELPVRPKELYDGAIPSANSVAFSNLLLLSRLTGDHGYEERADLISKSYASSVTRQPTAFTHFLNGLDLALVPGKEVVVTGAQEALDTHAILKALQGAYAPHLVAHLKSDQNENELTRLAGFTTGLESTQGQATAHICSGFNCKNSTTKVDILLKHLLNKA